MGLVYCCQQGNMTHNLSHFTKQKTDIK